jgi:hypothetical protein
MSVDQVRDAFEHWFSDGGEYPLACQRSGDGGYLLAAAESSWTAWQAATAPHAAEVEALRSALQRLASTEAFALPRVLHAASDVELLMRIDFARAALKGD